MIPSEKVCFATGHPYGGKRKKRLWQTLVFYNNLSDKIKKIKFNHFYDQKKRMRIVK